MKSDEITMLFRLLDGVDYVVSLDDVGADEVDADCC